MPRHPPYTLKSLTTFTDHRHDPASRRRTPPFDGREPLEPAETPRSSQSGNQSGLGDLPPPGGAGTRGAAAIAGSSPPTGHGSLSPKKVPDDAPSLREPMSGSRPDGKDRRAAGKRLALTQTLWSGRRGAAVTAPPSEGFAAVRPSSCNLVAPAAIDVPGRRSGSPTLGWPSRSTGRRRWRRLRSSRTSDHSLVKEPARLATDPGVPIVLSSGGGTESSAGVFTPADALY